MPGSLDFSVVIVSWNVSKLLQDCLESIFSLPVAEQPQAIFVVDNASGDGTVQMVQEKFPAVHLIANLENKGFAAANNQAIQKIPTGAVLLLNPDTVVQSGAFPRLLRALAEHPKAGIVGPKLLNPDGSLQPSVRRLPTPVALAAIALKIRHWWPKFISLRRYLAVDLDPAVEQVVGQVMGAAYLIRREVIESIGLLDEGFHVWFEEVDYCKRALDAGWGTWYVPDVVITHVGGESFQLSAAAKRVSYIGEGSHLASVFALRPSLSKQLQWHHSVLQYSRKHFSKVATAGLWLVGVVGVFVTWCAEFFQRHTLARLAAIPVLLALLTGLASFQVGLLSDDWDWYYEGRMTQQEITRPFTHNVGGAFYRPLATYSYALDYAIAPYNIPVARTQQLILFAITTALLVIFVWQMTGQAWAATAGGVFFSLWPQHHEVTTWLGSRPDLLSLLWILAALVTFSAAIRRNRPVLYLLTLLWSAAAILSKETGVLVIPALFLVSCTHKCLRDRRVWLTIIGSGIVIAFFLYIRSLVLGQLIGGYGDSQTQVGFLNFKILFLSTVEGWVNWSWLSSQLGAHTVKLVRYAVVAILGLSLLAGVVWRWQVFRKHWRVFVMLGAWFLLAVSISLPLIKSISPINLNGTRYLYLASAGLAVSLGFFTSLLKARKRIGLLIAITLAAAWLINLQPWRMASAENNSILLQIQKFVPKPPPNAIFYVRGLPGDTYGAFQWYARRSLPESLVAIYDRSDLYASTSLEASPYCNQRPQGQVIDFSYVRATKQVSYLGTRAIIFPKYPADKHSEPVVITKILPGSFVATTTAQAWQGHRGLVVTLDAAKSGFIALQLRGEGSMLYNRTVVRVKPGRNEIYFTLCAMNAWINNPPNRLVRILTPDSSQVTAVHLVAPYLP